VASRSRGPPGDHHEDGGHRAGHPIDLALVQAELAGREAAEGLEAMRGGQGRGRGRQGAEAPAIEDGSLDHRLAI
jgi:hypothetical protein